MPSSRKVAAEWEPTNYFIEEVRRVLDDPRLGATEAERAELLFGGGLRIHTTYDPAVQLAAEAAIDGLLPDDERAFAAALAALEQGTGYVRALVGGPGFEVFEFNIATQKVRPTGSSFKPYVLAAAVEKGFVPDDLLNGTGPCEFANIGGFPYPYIANNFGEDDGSVATVRSQTLASSNCAYVRLGLAVGLSNVAATARALGVTTDLSDLPISMPLGPKDVTPLDMATAYATFANGGLQVAPIFITRVEDRQGNVIFENAPRRERAISAQTALLVTSVLEANVRSGTGTRARLPEQAAAGKTGTAQNFADAWFVGYTPYLATAVWMGNPDEQIPMTRVDRGPLGTGSVSGGSLPAMIWGAFDTSYHERLDPVPFAAPASTREGLRIRTDQEEDVYNEVIESLCGPGNEEAEIDTDDDGRADDCDPERPEFEFDPGVGECPALYEPIDLDEDGALEGCTPPTTTTVPPSSSSTTTTTQPLDE
ncbi:MAG: transglycosylase domain-containing protein [Acidimicrobiales bacterium]